MSRRRDNPVGNLIQSFAEIRNDYSATRPSKFRRNRTGLPAMGSGADYHLRNGATWLQALEYARDLDRNDTVIGSMIDRAVDSTISDGIDPEPDTGNDELDQLLTERWAEWSADPGQCDVTGESTFDQLEQLAFRQMLVDGDVVALLTAAGAIQIVEAHRIRTPSNTKQNVVNGVLLNEMRERLEYWITKEEVNPNAPLKNVRDVTQVPVRDAEGFRNVCHIYNPKRSSQTRGVSALWPILDVAGMFEDINFAAMIKQQISACFAIIHEQAPGIDNVPGADTQIGDRTTETMNGGGTRTLESIVPGMRIMGRPGEKLQGFSPNVPGAEFFPHIDLLLTELSINFGLPKCVSTLDASETNFSGYRGAVEQARMGYRRNQRSMRDRFHRPVYLWKVRDWILNDPKIARLAQRKGVNPYAHSWRFPAWPYIDPFKDANANDLRLRGGQASLSGIAAEGGHKWPQIAGEMIFDTSTVIRNALTIAREINREFPENPDPIRWRDLVNIPTGAGNQVKQADLTSPDQPAEPNGNAKGTK